MEKGTVWCFFTHKAGVEATITMAGMEELMETNEEVKGLDVLYVKEFNAVWQCHVILT